MEITNEQEAEVVDIEEQEDEVEETPAPSETTDWEARAKKLEEKAIAQRERTRMLKSEIEKLKKATAPKPQPVEKTETGELSETQLDYLDLKGITHEDDIDIIQKVMKRTGQTVRQALSDDYVQAKLEKAKQAREVQNAMPSSSRRSGQTETNDVDYWVNKNEATGELPADFELRAKVIEAKMARKSDNTPPWRK